MKKAFLLYSGSLIFFSVSSYFFIDPNLIYFKGLFNNIAFSSRFFVTTLYLLLISLLFISYIAIQRQIKNNNFPLGEFKKYILVTIFILFLSYPAVLSYDIFNYIFTAKVLFFYQENPYLIMPIAFSHDPLLLFTHAANKIALYGPFWIVLSAVPFFLGFGNFILTLFAFKAYIVGFYIATIWVIWKITKRIESVVFFSLNPLVVVETLVSSHNDIVMVFLTLTSVYLLKKNHIVFSLLLLILAILIKYAMIILIPIYVYILWKKMTRTQIHWEKTFTLSALLLLIFMILVAPIREEIYPWYAIWFLSFVALIPDKKYLVLFSYIFSFCLMLRYIPYMYLGTYSFPTPFIKELVTFVPVGAFLLYFLIKNKIWLKS